VEFFVCEKDVDAFFDTRGNKVEFASQPRLTNWFCAKGANLLRKPQFVTKKLCKKEMPFLWGAAPHPASL